MIDFFFDFETRSRADLKTVGSVKYSIDPSTEATLLTWCFGRTGRICEWRLGQRIPDEIINVIRNPHLFRFIAWNIQFDYLIWTQSFAKKIEGYQKPDIKNLTDAMALSCHFRTGASLESASLMLNLPVSKDKEGRRIMLKQCKPNAHGEFPVLTKEEWELFSRYGKLDTVLLRDVFYRLPPLPEPERWAWEWTFIRNLRGIKLDLDLVAELDKIVNDNMPKLLREFDYCVGGKVKMNSPKAKDFFIQYYPWIQNMNADTMREILKDKTPVPPQIRRALEIKDLAGSTSISKIKAVKEKQVNGRVYELLAYHYTQTKRWSGRGPQIQNYPRPDGTLLDDFSYDMNVADLASIVRERSTSLKDPIGYVKNHLRRMWLPEAGHQFYCGDFSKVEPSVLFWLMDLGPIPKKWYEEMAAEIYNKPVSEITKDSDERQVGKTAALSCGYGAGWKSFITKTYNDTGIMLTEQEAKQVIGAYRRKYEVVVKFWRELENAFRKAIHGEATSLCRGKIHVYPMKYPWKGVTIRLPSGGYLFYHQAKESLEVFDEEVVEMINGVPHKYTVKKEKLVLKYLADQGNGRVGYDYVYGGLLCENVVSAIAREILVPAMWRLENAGMQVLGVVHDEVWASAEAGRDQEFNDLMCTNPSWCDMQIGSDLKVGVRYLK